MVNRTLKVYGYNFSLGPGSLCIAVPRTASVVTTVHMARPMRDESGQREGRGGRILLLYQRFTSQRANVREGQRA